VGRATGNYESFEKNLFSPRFIKVCLAAHLPGATMGCFDENQLVDFTQGLLPEPEALAFQAHLDECGRCRPVVMELARDLSTSAESDSHPPMHELPSAWRLLEPGTRVGRYQLLERVGVGAMGVVYAAWDPQLERKVALKLLRLDRSPAVAAQAQCRLLAEARSLAQVGCREVVSVYEVGTFEGQPFVAMELVEGGTLQRWLLLRRRPWQEVLEVFLDAGRGLAAAHAHEIVHRDFKPSNVLVGADGRAKVTDFGLAMRRTADAAVGPVGTPLYMAPELFDGASADARSDQYSFCVALHEALYGVRPYSGQSVSELSTNARRGTLAKPPGRRVPGHVRRALRRGLSPRPEDRFSSMTELLHHLAPRPRRLPAWMLAGGLLLAAAASALAWTVEPAPKVCASQVTAAR
jgi:hypothetical protein